jgi:excisionase family DNA binding protein
MNEPEGPRYITLADAAALTSIPAETLRHKIWEGKLKAYKPARQRLFREDVHAASLFRSIRRELRAFASCAEGA